MRSVTRAALYSHRALACRCWDVAHACIVRHLARVDQHNDSSACARAIVIHSIQAAHIHTCVRTHTYTHRIAETVPTWALLSPVLIQLLTLATRAHTPTSSEGARDTAQRPCSIDASAALLCDVRAVLADAVAYEASSRQKSCATHAPWRDELHDTMCEFLREWCERAAGDGSMAQPLSAVHAYLNDVNDPKVRHRNPQLLKQIMR
jgi:hypothetical protein